MPITFDFTTQKACDVVGDFDNARNIGTVNNVRASDYVEQEGSDCLDFGAATGGPHGVRTTDFTSSIDITEVDLGCWFLLPKGDDSVDQFLYDAGVASPGPGAGRESLRLRVYSTQSGGDRWAEYDQGSDDNLAGGWIYLRCSGDAGTEDGNSGTWTAADAAAVNSLAIIVYNVNANNGTGKSETARYGIDWIKSYNKIILTGFVTGSTPYDLDDIFDEGNQKPFWGVVERTETFYRFLCGLEFGNGTTSGAFSDENKYLFFDQYSTDVNYDVTVKKNNPTTFGLKDEGNDDTYALNGCQIINNIGVPDITVEDGAELNLYACRVEGWNVINLGSDGTSVIDIVKTDFFNNKTLEFRSEGIQYLNVRAHFSDGSQAAIGALYSNPTSARLLRVFQVTRGLVIRQDCTLEEYIAGDTVYDLVVLNGVSVKLINSSFNPNKLARVT